MSARLQALDCGDTLEQNVQTIPQCQNDAVQHDLVLLRSSHNIQHDVALHFEDDHSVVVEDDIAGLLRRLLEQPLLEGLLVLYARVGVGTRVVVALRVVRYVWRGVIFGQDARGVVGGEDEDGVDGEERHVGRHGGCSACALLMISEGDLVLCAEHRQSTARSERNVSYRRVKCNLAFLAFPKFAAEPHRMADPHPHPMLSCDILQPSLINSMLLHRLQRAQVELHSHRRWLSAFIQQARYTRIERPTRNSPLHPSGLRASPPARDGLRNAIPATATFATKKAKAKKQRLHLRLDIKGQREAEALDSALNGGDWRDVIHAYRSLDNKGTLLPRNINSITQQLHQALRESKWAQGPDERNIAASEIVEFAEELVKDIQRGGVAPSKRAHVRLLGIFKESGARDAGVTFWKWLEGQDELFVDADVCGAAIELMATHGTPLPELEELYQQALGRVSGTFASYHLSPDAILEDREKATTLQGMPMTLLQGILTARLLNGDVRSAYLALDTALRLYPDQLPARFFTIFSEERPVVEAYTVFAMAWRAGISIPLGHFKYQLSALRSNSDGVSFKTHPMALRAMLSALFMHVGARGAVIQNSVNEVIIAMTQLLRMDAISSFEPKDKQRVVRAVMEVIRKSLAVFARFGAKPGLAAFNSIIVNLGGYGHSKQTIGVALADVRALGMEPNDITRRSIIVAAGLLDDEDLMKKAWGHIVEMRTAAGQQPDAVDFHCLIKAAHLTDQIAFAREVFGVYQDGFEEHEREAILNGLNDGNAYNLGVAEGQEQFQVSSLMAEIEKISADLDIIHERTKEPGKLQDYSNQSLPMKLLVDDEVSLPEADLRRIYDEVTTEQHSPQPSQPSITGATEELIVPSVSSQPQPTLTPTNIPFSTIRYENWKLINWLLELSEANDQAYRNVVDKAIAAGVAPPARSKGLAWSLARRDVESIGLSDMVEGGERRRKERTARAAQEEDVRMAQEHILRLRGRM